jgi:hypothetical protein
VQEVEDHLRNLNKTQVASDLDSNLANCNQNLNVTNAEPLNALNINASCVFCRQSVLSGDHTKCVANNLLHRHKKRRTDIPSRSTTASKYTLGKLTTTVSNDVVVTPHQKSTTLGTSQKLVNLPKIKQKLVGTGNVGYNTNQILNGFLNC